MSTKLVPTFEDRVCRVVSATDQPTAVNLGFLDLEPSDTFRRTSNMTVSVLIFNTEMETIYIYV
jgi:hypothetical protein